MKKYQSPKTSSSDLKIVIREVIKRATGPDPGCVHPEYLLTPARGGIRAVCLEHEARQTCFLAAHFLPVHPDTSTRWIAFNLN